MALILGIESSCDETGAAVFDTSAQKILSNALFSQIAMHSKYGGVVPEVASRSQLEKINLIIDAALSQAGISIEQIDALAVTNTPGLVGSLLVGVCFAKGIAWSLDKKIIGVNHLEGHAFSGFLNTDGLVNKDLKFPLITFSASGGHTALYYVSNFGNYSLIGETLDDAAGEAFDKISKVIGLGYPGGAIIEKLASEVNFEDFFHYPRNKIHGAEISFSFSGLKTAVLYDLVKKGVYDLSKGPIENAITHELRQQVASSLLVCIGDIFCTNIQRVFKKYPDVKNFTFVGGVACNKYLRKRIAEVCTASGKGFFAAAPQFCTDNGGMIAFVGGYKFEQGKFADLTLDVLKEAP